MPPPSGGDFLLTLSAAGKLSLYRRLQAVTFCSPYQRRKTFLVPPPSGGDFLLTLAAPENFPCTTAFRR